VDWIYRLKLGNGIDEAGWAEIRKPIGEFSPDVRDEILGLLVNLLSGLHDSQN